MRFVVASYAAFGVSTSPEDGDWDSLSPPRAMLLVVVEKPDKNDGAALAWSPPGRVRAASCWSSFFILFRRHCGPFW